MDRPGLPGPCATAWIDARLHELGLAPHRRRRAAARRPVVDGDAGPDRRRRGVVQGQQRASCGTRPRWWRPGRARVPDAVPPLLAVDPDSGWMLMAGRGRSGCARSCREERSLARWLDVLDAVRRSPARPARTTSTGCSRWACRTCGWPTLPEKLRPADGRDRRRAAVPRGVGAGAGAVPRSWRRTGCRETLQHDDLHDGQVFVARRPAPGHGLGRRLHLAPVLHPVGDAGGRGRVGRWTTWRTPRTSRPFLDAYLRPYAERYDGDLVAGGPSRCGWAGRAGRSTATCPGDDEPTLTRLRMFLDGRPD